MEFTTERYDLRFSFNAGTSRGVLTEKPSWFIRIQEGDKTGTGEVSLIPGLNPESEQTIETLFNKYTPLIKEHGLSALNDLNGAPSFYFGWEAAFLDLKQAGEGIIYPGPFVQGKKSIPVNGLIWMGSRKDMLRQVHDKVDSGFTCIKMKIGAMDFNEELALLKDIRRDFSEKEIELRVDANGAFDPSEAAEKLKRLSDYYIHSIEQPVKPEHKTTLRELSQYAPVPVALDESLIGIETDDEKRALLSNIKPAYIILKPSLTGGIKNAEAWINIAESLDIGWWITSALESNIGLNIIAQWTASLDPQMPQGLGTGQLFTNNIPSPLYIKEGRLHFDSSQQ